MDEATHELNHAPRPQTKVSNYKQPSPHHLKSSKYTKMIIHTNDLWIVMPFVFQIEYSVGP